MARELKSADRPGPPPGPACVLTIAGSDSGGGAGIQADSRVIRDLGAHALTAVTAVTAQDGRRVSAWKPVGPALLRAQISAALGGFSVRAVKTGLLPGPSAVRAIAGLLGGLAQRPPLVVDPVLGSTSGTVFLGAAGLQALRRELLPLATVVTPNWPEASALLGRPIGPGPDGAAGAARRLADLLGCAVLLKGGHAPGPGCDDLLALPGRAAVRFRGRRIQTNNTHGTGCSLSAAIAAHLALGQPLPEAIRRARAGLRRALEAGRRLDWGPGADGPAWP